jgi:hypothetical protein
MGKVFLLFFVGIPLVIAVAWNLLMRFEDAGAERAMEWDKKIDLLCKQRFGKDKAYKVFEQVASPPGYYRALQKDLILPRVPSYEGAVIPTDKPILARVVTLEVLHKETPSVRLYAEQVLRVADGKVLAENYFYKREGTGGALEIGYLNMHRCPQDNSDIMMTVDLFTDISKEDINFGRYQK